MGQVKMIKDHFGNDPVNPDPCLQICAGSSGSGKTKWYGEKGSVSTDVDISKCRFVTTPILTTSMNGRGYIDFIVGMTSPKGMTKDRFRITVLGKALTSGQPSKGWMPTPAIANNLHWNINWIAVGFTC